MSCSRGTETPARCLPPVSERTPAKEAQISLEIPLQTDGRVCIRGPSRTGRGGVGGVTAASKAVRALPADANLCTATASAWVISGNAGERGARGYFFTRKPAYPSWQHRFKSVEPYLLLALGAAVPRKFTAGALLAAWFGVRPDTLGLTGGCERATGVGTGNGMGMGV